MENRERDKQLDIYRSLSMIYILCVIHVIYWLEVGSEPLKSILLIEMPIIFFISGAASRLSHKNDKRFSEVLLNRFKRVLLPYYIYALITILIFLFLSILPIDYFEKFHNLQGYKISDIISILLTLNIPHIPFVYHIWFIIPYFIISISTKFQVNMMRFIPNWIYIALNLLLICIMSSLWGILQIKDQGVIINLAFSNIQYIIGYNLFYIIGYLYYKRMTIKEILYCLIIAICLYGVLGHFTLIPMQNHKFPIDEVFITYNLTTLCILSLIFSFIKLPENTFIRIWNTKGYTIYLYQNIVFFFVAPIIHRYQNLSSWITFILTFILIFTISTCLSYFTYPLEKYIMNSLFNRTTKKNYT